MLKSCWVIASLSSYATPLFVCLHSNPAKASCGTPELGHSPLAPSVPLGHLVGRGSVPCFLADLCPIKAPVAAGAFGPLLALGNNFLLLPLQTITPSSFEPDSQTWEHHPNVAVSCWGVLCPHTSVEYPNKGSAVLLVPVFDHQHSWKPGSAAEQSCAIWGWQLDGNVPKCRDSHICAFN